MRDEVDALRAQVSALAARVEALEALAEARALAIPMLDLGRSLNARFNYAREWETEITVFQATLLRQATAEDGVPAERLNALHALGDRILAACR